LAKEITKNVRIFPSILSLSKGKFSFEFLAKYKDQEFGSHAHQFN
jgi:hypothetical protein